MDLEMVEINDENTAPAAVNVNFPLSRVKKISKLVAPACNFTAEAVQLLTIGAETYIQLLGKAAAKFAQLDNRKTIQYKDICRCMERDWHFSILEDAIDEWPESQGGLLQRPAGPAVSEKSRCPKGKPSNDTNFVCEATEFDEHISGTVFNANRATEEESIQNEETTSDFWDADIDEDFRRDGEVSEMAEGDTDGTALAKPKGGHPSAAAIRDIEDF